MHQRPRDVRTLELIFGCRIEFDAKHDEFEFERRILDFDTNGSLSIFLPFFERLIRREIALLPRADQTVRETTQAAIESLLGTGNCTARFISASLGMSEKKLQRLLAEEGTSFAAILSRTRLDHAVHALTESNIEISDLASLLDYSSISAFSNAFVRWKGVSPSVFRKDSRKLPPVEH